jgi:hypothetical protein
MQNDTINDGTGLPDDADNLKSHLKTLHRHLEETGKVDDEMEMLLRQLDGDIKHVLDKRADDPDTSAFGLASRTQELTARFALKHPTLEPALRELNNILTSMGI